MDKEICLTIAGSDPSGGAGIQADIRTFEKCGVYPLSVITAITFQTAESFIGYKAVPIEDLESQLKVLFDNYKIKYAKTGMIPTIEAVKVISKYLNKYKVNYVVDPVTISSAGDRLAEKVHTYFDKVYVNVDDKIVKNNRLAMLRKIYSLYAQNIADLAQVVRENR